ncbi:MAG: permease-like cell division protein FtsX [Muribaculaceae bacterium]|nr:permease-like cell division protein FtsX [Muribaculaceae bacterium]
MKNQKEFKISFWAAHATTIVSVTLVLLIVGIIAMITISADRETRRLRQQIEITAIIADSIPDTSAQHFLNDIRKQPYCLDAQLITAAQALEQWKQDTGEDLEELFGVNPLTPEVTFHLKAEYTSPENITRIAAQIAAVKGIQEVVTPDSGMLTAMNTNISRLTTILAIIAAVMLIISFVLINNTVHLTIYARRFTIHTMQLVGATNAFIRMPIVMQNMLAGVVSGLVAAGIIAVAMASATRAGLEDLANSVGWPTYALIAAGIIMLGAILCALAALISTGKYLRKDYDKLFK